MARKIARARRSGRESPFDCVVASASSTILIVASDDDRASTLGRALVPFGAFSVHHVLPFSSPPFSSSRVDLAVIELGSSQSLLWAHEMAVGGAEIVLFVDNARCEAVKAARAVGITRIVSATDLCQWLPSAAAPLVRCAQARRALRQAELDLPATPCHDSGEALPILPFRVAEETFRDAYLARLLATCPNRKDAAKRARLPYRTLCAIVQKYDLRLTRSRDFDRSDSQSRALDQPVIPTSKAGRRSDIRSLVGRRYIRGV